MLRQERVLLLERSGIGLRLVGPFQPAPVRVARAQALGARPCTPAVRLNVPGPSTGTGPRCRAICCTGPLRKQYDERVSSGMSAPAKILDK